MKIFDLIRSWAQEKGIFNSGNSKTQVLKLGEEYGELCKALLEGSTADISDAIGDMVVVLTSTAHLNGLKIEDCVEGAYNEIKDRTGAMKNGTFVRNKV